MANQINGIFSKLADMTIGLFRFQMDNINEEIDENMSPLEKAMLYGNSNLKCRKILFIKDIIKLLNNIDYTDFQRDIYPLIVKLSDESSEIKYEICNKIGDLCAYILQNNNDGCSDVISLLFPIVEKFIINYENNKNILRYILKSLLILSTHVNIKTRKKQIFPFLIYLICNDAYKQIGFILLIKMCYIFDRDNIVIYKVLIPFIEKHCISNNIECKILISSYFFNICKMLDESNFIKNQIFIFNKLCNDEYDTIKIINIFNCTHLSSIYSKNLFFNFFLPIFNNFLKNNNLYVFYYSLINLLLFLCIFEDINIIHPFYIRKIIFFFNNLFSSHLFTLNYLNEMAKKKTNYIFLDNTDGVYDDSNSAKIWNKDEKRDDTPSYPLNETDMVTDFQNSKSEKNNEHTIQNTISNELKYYDNYLNEDMCKEKQNNLVEISEKDPTRQICNDEQNLTTGCNIISPINGKGLWVEDNKNAHKNSPMQELPQNKSDKNINNESDERDKLGIGNISCGIESTEESKNCNFSSESEILNKRKMEKVLFSSEISELECSSVQSLSNEIIYDENVCIFINNKLINDLIIKNHHFCSNISQFFKTHGNDYYKNGNCDKYFGRKIINLMEKNSDDLILENKINGETIESEEFEKDKENYFINLNEKDIKYIDNIFNHDDNIDILQIKGCYYSELEIIKNDIIYGKMLLRQKRNMYKINNNNKCDSSDNITYDIDYEDIYAIEGVDTDSLKKLFLFDTPNNVIVSYNINAVYIITLHIPGLILILKEYFFRFFSHVFFFICTYPYYFVRKTIASLFYDILSNLMESPFFKINTDKLYEDRINMKKQKKNLKKNKKIEETAKKKLKEECSDDIKKKENNYDGEDSTEQSNLYTYKENNIKHQDINHIYKKEPPEIVQTFNNDYATYNNMKRIQNNSFLTSDKSCENTEDFINSCIMEKHEDVLEKEENKLCDDTLDMIYSNNSNTNGSHYSLDQDDTKNITTDTIDQIKEDKNDIQLKRVKKNAQGYRKKWSYDKMIKKVQNKINNNLYANDFFINEENENFFFYINFLGKYEMIYIKYIQKFKKYYSDNSPLHFFHFFIYYFLNDSNVLVKKAILKNYDKIIEFFPNNIQKIFIKYLSDVVNFKTLNYSLRKKVSKIVFKILSKINDAKIVRNCLFPIFMRLCKDEAAIIRTYTSNYFYLFIEKGCPRIYNFFKNGGEILPLEDYKKDIILTNLENDELRSFHFISGEEIYILKTVITTFYKSDRFYDRQVFIKICDGIINECPKNLFLLYFLKPFLNLSDDKVHVVRMTWENCVVSQIQKRGYILSIPSILEKLNNFHEENNINCIGTNIDYDVNKYNSISIETFDVDDLAS
ncbi:conserved Plasmodium protein, unknown function [Plasmodium yoelii]|nr:conserved Plasmodium protein, unknown function [Plasmodium yoelii]CDU16783.1 conserved Plasmodium protein, unknown function [Plasmodium yoelii]VTZ74392.1 conserved Plasmodium protein, unknown function [Plasmodium yoelii]|eukprot:XP_022811697.1 conserved Plasmodium protein, unknown function [Plasmodium yoelii]